MHKAGGGSEGGRYRNRAAVADGRHRKRAVVTGSGRPLQAAVAGSGQPLQATVAGTMPRGKMPQQAGDSDRDGLCVNTHPGEAKCLTPATYDTVKCAAPRHRALRARVAGASPGRCGDARVT